MIVPKKHNHKLQMYLLKCSRNTYTACGSFVRKNDNHLNVTTESVNTRQTDRCMNSQTDAEESDAYKLLC